MLPETLKVCSSPLKEQLGVLNFGMGCGQDGSRSPGHGLQRIVCRQVDTKDGQGQAMAALLPPIAGLQSRLSSLPAAPGNDQDSWVQMWGEWIDM